MRVATFRGVLGQLRSQRRFSPARVGAVDELPLHFQLMVEKKSSCVLRQAGMETASASIILAATADGRLLPPMVVFKVFKTS